MRHLHIGRVELWTLDDGSFDFPARLFFANAPASQWVPRVHPDAEGRILVGHNHGLLRAGRELIVVDTGYGDDTHGGRAGHLLDELARSGHGREQVTQVVATHAHGDHIKRHTLVHDGLRTPTFPHARYRLSRKDWDWFSGPGHVPEFDEQIAPLEAWGLLTLFDGACELVPGVRLLPTPGHTPGHTSVVVESEGRTAILLGDVCHHPLHFSHPDWVSSFDTHPEQTPATRARVFEMAVERDALLLCPHAPSPGLGRLRRHDGRFEWHPLVSS